MSAKYSGWTPRELVKYLEVYSDNTEVRALLDAMHPYFNLVDGLIDAGMSRDDWTFDYGESPGDYIDSMRHDLLISQDECSDRREEIDRLEDDLRELRGKTELYTVAQLLSSAVEEVSRAKMDARSARTNLSIVQDERDDLKAKLNTWNILCTPPPN